MTRARVFIALAAIAASAGLQAARTTDVPVALSYRNDVADGVTSDGLMSLSGLPYQYVNGVADNIGAILKGGGNLIYTAQYDASVTPRRAICIGFGEQASPLGVQQLCAHANQNMAPPLDALTSSPPLTAMHYGDSVDKRLQIWWDDASTGYRYQIRYGGDMNGDGVADAPNITVSCVSPTNATQSCAQWAVTSDAYTIVGRSKLLKGGQLGSFEFLGYYNLPFQMTVSKPM
jgi:hypothetical protein